MKTAIGAHRPIAPAPLSAALGSHPAIGGPQVIAHNLLANPKMHTGMNTFVLLESRLSVSSIKFYKDSERMIIYSYVFQ